MVRPTTEDDTGIKVLYEPSNPNIDIVAVHGLGAHPDDTWCKNVGTAEKPEWINWLEASFMLPEATPNARIMRYGYMSQWYGKNAIKQSTSDVAKDFLINLKRWRRDAHRALVIIAHCFGGLVVLKALNDARNHENEYPTIFNYTTGLVFLGTPFRGAGGMSQSGLLQAVIQEYEEVQAQTFRILDPGNDPLHDLVEEFCLIRSTPPRAHVACFYEQIASDVMVILGKNGTRNFVVDRESACLDQSERTRTYPIARDHFDMNKFGKPTNEYYKVAEAIQEMVEAAQELIHARANIQVDERKIIAAVKRLINITERPIKEQCQEHAERVQEDMSTLIKSAFEKANFTKSVAIDPYHGPRTSDHRDADVKRILAIIRIDTTVRINRRIQPQLSTSSSFRLAAQSYHDSINIANGNFAIRTTKHKTAADQDASFMSVITFTADETQYKQFMLTMHLLQIYGAEGSNILPPCIIAHTVIPHDSPILEAMKDGKYETFVWLLDTGRAKVWDCDTQGRSLLTHAIGYRNPRMVEYLVLQGLDVNSVEFPTHGDISQTHTLRTAGNASLLYPPYIQKVFDFQVMLLEAGSDPTFKMFDSDTRYVNQVMNLGREEQLRALFHSSHYLITLGIDDLIQCAQNSTEDTWAKLRLLVVYGAADRCDGDWKDKLLPYMIGYHYPLDYIKTLRSLLHHGVNIYAKNSNGQDLCDLLQKQGNAHSCVELDILYCVVEREAECQPHLLNWISNHPRQPSIYDLHLTRHHPFNHLRLRSELCHDKPDQKVLDHWKSRFETSAWPDMSPEEEHTIAHGSYTRRGESLWRSKWTRWTPSGEAVISESHRENTPEEVVERKPITFPCADCVSRWLHDRRTVRPRTSDDLTHQRDHVRFVATHAGGIWDITNSTEEYLTYAWVPTPSSEWLRYSEDGVEKVIKTVHVPRLSEILDSDIYMQQDHEVVPGNSSRCRGRTMSSSDEDDRMIKRPRLDDFEHDPTSPGSNSDFSDA